MSDSRIVVVGTTSDYIDHIRRNYPGRALFITDPQERARAAEAVPESYEEVLTGLNNFNHVLETLRQHLNLYGMKPAGVACYDCESLGLSAYLARKLGLMFPSENSIKLSRNKFFSKNLWQQAGLPCPAVILVRDLSDMLQFMDKIGKPLIIKPLTGAGSELVFKCSDHDDCRKAFETIKSQMITRRKLRLYHSEDIKSAGVKPLKEFAAEEFVEGTEYSCDFMIETDRLEIFRIARKINAHDQSPGTVMAYVVPAGLPDNIDYEQFKLLLANAAHIMGLKHAVCMVDFIVHQDNICLLEITPRPGGDCLPRLISYSFGLDMIGLALDFAEGKPVFIPEALHREAFVGLRILAKRSGVIRSIDEHAIVRDSRVRECHILRSTGHKVIFPPDDYESRLLGHVIFKPASSECIEQECLEIESKLVVEMEDSPWESMQAH